MLYPMMHRFNSVKKKNLLLKKINDTAPPADNCENELWLGWLEFDLRQKKLKYLN